MKVKNGSYKISKHHMENGKLQYYCINFNELKPRQWIDANDFPDDKVEFEYWIDVAKQFTDISLDFLSNDDFSIEVVPDFESNSQLLEHDIRIDNIVGTEEILTNTDNKKLFISEFDSKKDILKKDISNKQLSRTAKSKNPSINLQYFYDQANDSLNSQSENESLDFADLEDAAQPKIIDPDTFKKSETDEILQVVLPTYYIEKRAYYEENDLFLKDDLAYAEIAEGVSKRSNLQDARKKIKIESQKNIEIYKMKVIEKKRLNKPMSFIPKSTNILNSDDDSFHNQIISIKNCFKIDDIIFFVVDMNSKIDDDQKTETKNPQTICIPENIMKKHFPNILIDYYEKHIVFN